MQWAFVFTGNSTAPTEAAVLAAFSRSSVPPPVLLLCLCVATERQHGSHLGTHQWPHRDCRGADQGGRQPRPPELGERFPHFTPPFLPQFQGFFHDPVDIGPSRWRLFGSTQFRAKMAEKMPQNKTTPFVR